MNIKQGGEGRGGADAFWLPGKPQKQAKGENRNENKNNTSGNTADNDANTSGFCVPPGGT